MTIRKFFFIGLVVLIFLNFNAKASEQEDDISILESSATHLATFRHFRNNVDNGIQLIEPAFEAFCLMHQTFISLGSLYASCLTIPDLSSGFLATQSYMKNLEEKFKLIPLPRTFIIGPEAFDSIEIGCFPITFESLGLGSLNNLVTQNFNEILEENKNSLIYNFVDFYPSLIEASKKLSKWSSDIGSQKNMLYSRRRTLDQQIAVLIDERNKLLKEAEKSSSSFNALSLAKLNYQKQDIPCRWTFFIDHPRSILKEFMG